MKTPDISRVVDKKESLGESGGEAPNENVPDYVLLILGKHPL